LVFFLLLLIAAAGLGTRWWVMRQYYIGATDDGQVSIFRGVSGSFLGVSLHTVAEGSCPPGSEAACEPITINDLRVSSRDVVRNGITKGGLEEAREGIRKLRTENVLPPCADASKPSTTTATTSSATTTTGTPTSGATTTTESSQATPSSDATPLQTPTQTPGTDCRRKGQ
ncbi:MAG TPA: protein phosphatase, partial [Umezawaea sp.]|nr:protein phosphatase [Umezawaea sp.]